MSFLSPEQLAIISEEQAKKKAEQLLRVDALSIRLSAEAVRRSGLRQQLEERWLEDLQQFNGVYNATVMANIKAAEGSQIFINITRPRVKTAAARLGDMLFPTDDRNWGLDPTPVPELVKALNDETPLMDTSGKPIMGEPDPETGEAEPLTNADKAAAIMAKAKESAVGMAMEIDDQLTEAQYPSKCRRAIHDACLFGTGVIKGPILTGRTRRKWKTVTGPRGQTVRVLEHEVDPRPGMEHVDIWNFFPEMEVASMTESASNFERMYFTKGKLAALKRQPGYLAANIDAAILLGPKVSQITRYAPAEKRDSAGAQGTIQSGENNLFEAWEYHGTLEREDLAALGVEVDDKDPLVMDACVVFVGAKVIKAYIEPLETGAQPYKVFVYERDESSIFGFGVSYRMRNSQAMLNGAVRALMDNAALSVGPQIIIAKRYVTPADSNWKLKGRKVWEMTDPNKSVRDVMAAFNIDSHQEELQAIMALAERFADMETNLPSIAQGEQGQVTKTSSGMALLNTNSNVITRDTAKNWDDGITTPTIRDFYDWNMQNSEKDWIKGDYEVDARGSSVLLAKEIQSQNLMTLGNTFAKDPLFGPMTKPLPLYRKIVQAMHVAPDDVVSSDAEYRDYQRRQTEQVPPEVQAEQLRAENEERLLDIEHKNNMALEDKRAKNRRMEISLELQDNALRYATQERMGLDKLKSLLAEVQIEGSFKRVLQQDKMRFEAGNPKPAKAPPKPAARRPGAAR